MGGAFKPLEEGLDQHVQGLSLFFPDSSSVLTVTRKVGANKNKSVTKIASMGMWVPVHDDEWDGDIPLENGTPRVGCQSGEVAFKGGALPWKTGIYEVRRFCMKPFELVQPALDPLSPRWEIQRHGHGRADRSIRSVLQPLFQMHLHRCLTPVSSGQSTHRRHWTLFRSGTA